MMNMKSKLICVALLTLVIAASCKQQNKAFTLMDPDDTGIQFNNDIQENDSINPLDIINIYNGGGIGVGDFNQDGLPDLFFAGNTVSSKLYLNEGNLKFKDVTDAAGVQGLGRWCRGVSIVDINGDGKQDIYISASLTKNPERRRNILYVNQGMGKEDGIPVFKDMATAYGLADSGHSTHTAFFDYDNDGDLDAYVLTNEVNTGQFPDNFHPVNRNGENPSTGRLYQNHFDSSLNHPVFTDVSKQAGIQTEGYGHSVNIVDINMDGWKDIYVTNDFISNDLLWINNHDGTFSNQLDQYFKHTSANAMGCDIVDINNDGLADVFALDMNPQDNFRKKMMLNANAYQKYQNSDRFGFNYQYVRNTLQLNQGPRVNAQDSVGAPVFSDISYYAGMAETDWSWTPLLADFNNDGIRDLIVTNGYPKDVTDHDFIAYRNQATNLATKDHILSQIPEVKLHNYSFQGNGDLTFTDKTEEWGFADPSFSNGAVYADLDNDGDLEVIINNIKGKASLYRNNARQQQPDSSHYVQVSLQGRSPNTEGLGAVLKLYHSGNKMQVYEHSPYRGYLSSVEGRVHFGLGGVAQFDSLLIQWPNGYQQLIPGGKTDTVIRANIEMAKTKTDYGMPLLATNTIFRQVTDSVGMNYVHQEKDFVDFNIQKLLPHKFSEFGPALAVGDIDNNGLDDVVCGGSIGNSARLFLQQKGGRFAQQNLTNDTGYKVKPSQDLGLLLFDADGDQDLDLYIASGGYVYGRDAREYQDRLYVNNGKGKFSLDTSALPLNHHSKMCVRAADVDKDGDLDLFVSGRVDPWNFPKPVTSFVYLNQSTQGKPKFVDATATIAKDLMNAGMVCDALFTDVDNDSWPDLILAGEFMPITVLKNVKGQFSTLKAPQALSDAKGFWNALVPGDFDNDGDIDLIAGNAGLNTFYKASSRYPVSVYAKDFDNNGSYDAIPSVFIPTSMTDTTRKEYPAFGRDDLIKQMIGMRSKYQSYNAYAVATMDSVLSKEQRKDMLVVRATETRSMFLRNDGKGNFTMAPLPAEAQMSMLCGMVAEDFDGDGLLDLAISGNDYGTEVATGRYDALNGLFLKGDGKGGFTSQRILQSGLFIPGNGKSLVSLTINGQSSLLAAQNRGPLQLFFVRKPAKMVKGEASDAYAEIRYANGVVRKQEFYYGNSYLSQSARTIQLRADVSAVNIVDNKGQSRKIDIR